MSKNRDEQSKYQGELHAALQLVRDDAASRARISMDAMHDKPLDGWSTWQHVEYHQKRIDEASAVQHYCFIRMMQIEPD